MSGGPYIYNGDVLRPEGIFLGLGEARVEVLTDDHEEGKASSTP